MSTGHLQVLCPTRLQASIICFKSSLVPSNKSLKTLDPLNPPGAFAVDHMPPLGRWHGWHCTIVQLYIVHHDQPCVRLFKCYSICAKASKSPVYQPLIIYVRVCLNCACILICNSSVDVLWGWRRHALLQQSCRIRDVRCWIQRGSSCTCTARGPLGHDVSVR